MAQVPDTVSWKLFLHSKLHQEWIFLIKSLIEDRGISPFAMQILQRQKMIWAGQLKEELSKCAVIPGIGKKVTRTDIRKMIKLCAKQAQSVDELVVPVRFLKCPNPIKMALGAVCKLPS